MRAPRAEDLRESVAFDAATGADDGFGGREVAWLPVHACRAEFAYKHGREAVQAGGLTGSASFRVRIRACGAARALTPAHRMRDIRRSLAFQIREVDLVTDSRWIFLVVEAGVAV